MSFIAKKASFGMRSSYFPCCGSSTPGQVPVCTHCMKRFGFAEWLKNRPTFPTV